jgi:hypothetical protein
MKQQINEVKRMQQLAGIQLNENEAITNTILDKISQSGMSSLTDFEKQYLNKISQEEDISSLKMDYLKNVYLEMGYDTADIEDIFEDDILHYGNPSTGDMGEADIEDIEGKLGEDIFEADKEELKKILQQLNPSGEDLEKGGWI